MCGLMDGRRMSSMLDMLRDCSLRGLMRRVMVGVVGEEGEMGGGVTGRWVGWGGIEGSG